MKYKIGDKVIVPFQTSTEYAIILAYDEVPLYIESNGHKYRLEK